MAFRGSGITGYVPGLHTEIRAVAKILNLAFTETKIRGKAGRLVQNPELRGQAKSVLAAKIVGQYGMAKLEPGLQRGTEALMGQNWQGRPLPWSDDKGTDNKPRMTWGEYAGSIGPIPLEGPIGYVYDSLRKDGASAMDANKIIKGLIIFGGGLPGLHIKEDHANDMRKKKITPAATDR